MRLISVQSPDAFGSGTECLSNQLTLVQPPVLPYRVFDSSADRNWTVNITHTFYSCDCVEMSCFQITDDEQANWACETCKKRRTKCKVKEIVLYCKMWIKPLVFCVVIEHTCLWLLSVYICMCVCEWVGYDGADTPWRQWPSNWLTGHLYSNPVRSHWCGCHTISKGCQFVVRECCRTMERGWWSCGSLLWSVIAWGWDTNIHT